MHAISTHPCHPLPLLRFSFKKENWDI
jgi:hypothetical protein